MAKALFYTDVRRKRNLPPTELIEVLRGKLIRFGFATSLKLGLELIVAGIPA